MRLATLAGMGKRGKKYVGRLESVLLIRVTLLPLERYIRFQLANQCSIFSTMTSQMLETKLELFVIFRDQNKCLPFFFLMGPSEGITTRIESIENRCRKPPGEDGVKTRPIEEYEQAWWLLWTEFHQQLLHLSIIVYLN
jgi:hypothetical protein